MSGNLKLYGAVMGKHVPMAAREALGEFPYGARALVTATHKGLAMRAAEQAGIKVNLNGWRVASSPRNDFGWQDADALLRTRILHSAKPGEVLLSRPTASGFVARWCHGAQRWTRVALFTEDKQAVLMPGAVDEILWDRDGDRWEVRADSWSARCVTTLSMPGDWLSLDIVQVNHGPLRRLS